MHSPSRPITNVYIGDLQSVDGYMNIALERCKEVSDGRVTRNWGDAFVRGNNGIQPSRNAFHFTLY
jgi:small nuclear ribonucleoprotein (snRNP)-like protein